VRIFYASDLHGSEKLFVKFLNAAPFYDAEVLIMGGDMTGKVMVPLVELGPVKWTAKWFDRQRTVKGEDEAAELERLIRLNGHYPIRITPDEHDRLEHDEQYRERVFTELMRAEIERWVALAHEKVDGTGVRCFLMPGNDDEWAIDSVLDASEAPVENVDGRVIEFEGVQMLSSAWANPTPWKSPRELPEEQLLERLHEQAKELDPGLPTIFNLHVPPRDSGLDLAPELTEDLRVVTEGGEPKLTPAGSDAVRELIEEFQPALGLHGHIHESRAAQKIGPTLCINPGSTYAEGVIDGALVDLRDGDVASYQLVTG
jgi:uncharacterized protein